MKRLIVFLIRKRLGLKRNEHFRFAEQVSQKDYYYFTKDSLIKSEFRITRDGKGRWESKPSNCSLNWLLNADCKIVRIDM